MPMASFRKLGAAVVEDLLNRNSDKVRKATALQILLALGVREAKAYLTRYLDPNRHRYYTAIDIIM